MISLPKLLNLLGAALRLDYQPHQCKTTHNAPVICGFSPMIADWRKRESASLSIFSGGARKGGTESDLGKLCNISSKKTAHLLHFSIQSPEFRWPWLSRGDLSEVFSDGTSIQFVPLGARDCLVNELRAAGNGKTMAFIEPTPEVQG